MPVYERKEDTGTHTMKLSCRSHIQTNNNRPISLLPALSKVCERVAYNQFVTYLTTKERLTTKQSGNKKWFSTETSLIHTTEAFLKGIDDKNLTS